MFLKYKLQNAGRYLTRRRDYNIFHCCIQKTATQWFKGFFERISNEPGIRLLSMPGGTFIPRQEGKEAYLRQIPGGVIVSPLYIYPDDFLRIYGERNFRAFFVMRDPRDLIVSDYFSLKGTHPIKNEYFAEWRHKLNQMGQKEGLAARITNMDWNYYEPLKAWAALRDDRSCLVRFEEFFGKDQEVHAKALLQHLDIHISPERLGEILEEMSFEKKIARSGGWTGRCREPLPQRGGGRLGKLF